MKVKWQKSAETRSKTGQIRATAHLVQNRYVRVIKYPRQAKSQALRLDLHKRLHFHSTTRRSCRYAHLARGKKRSAITRRADRSAGRPTMQMQTSARKAIACIALSILAASSGTAAAQDAINKAQAYADAVRLLEQSTFGPTPSLISHVMQVGTQAFLDEQYAAPSSQYPPIKYVPAGQQATFCPTDPDPAVRARLLLAVPCAERILHQRAAQSRPAQTARRVRAVADSRHLRAHHQRSLRNGALPADIPRSRVRQLRADPDPCDVVTGDGRIPEHGQQRQALGERQSERELRARAAAAVHRRRLATEPGWHAQAGCKRATDFDVRAG